MSLFQKRPITLSSGASSDFKIECDALTDEDIECIAYLVSQRFKFKTVIGVPTGGLRLMKALVPYCSADADLWLICDDVLTTGRSMNNCKVPGRPVQGIVIFARGECPDWVWPVFQLNKTLLR